MLTFLKRWGLAVGMMLSIFVASSLPKDQLPNFDLWDLWVKKTSHAIGYSLLAAGYLRGLTYGKQATTRRAMMTALILCGVYAISDEVHQVFVPGRGATVVDVGIDVLGAGITLGIKWAVSGVRKWQGEKRE